MSVEELSKVITETRISLAKMGQVLDGLNRNVKKLQDDVEEIKSKVFGLEKDVVTKAECRERKEVFNKRSDSLFSLKDKIIGGLIIGSAILSTLLTLFGDSILANLNS